MARHGASRGRTASTWRLSWWRCHRRIITNHLLFRGEEVTHLMAIGKSAEATPTPGAQRLGASNVIYPAKNSEGDLETGEKLDHGFDGSPDASELTSTRSTVGRLSAGTACFASTGRWS